MEFENRLFSLPQESFKRRKCRDEDVPMTPPGGSRGKESFNHFMDLVITVPYMDMIRYLSESLRKIKLNQG